MTKRVLLYFALLLWFVVPVTAQPTIFVEDISTEPENNIAIKVKAVEYINIVSMQFSVNWDPSFLAFDSVTVNGLLPDYTMNSFGTNFSENGKVTTAWFNPALTGITLEDTATIFTLHYTVLGESGTSSDIEITGDPTDIEFSIESGAVIDVIVESGTVTVLEANGLNDLLVQSNKTFTLYQNEPNPFDNQTVIRFDVHEPSDFILEVYDSKGMIVYTEKAYYLSGNQAITLKREMLPATGAFVYKLKTKDYFITNRMILVR